MSLLKFRTNHVLQLAICILGIYVFFLTWGVLQERITTVDYHLRSHYERHTQDTTSSTVLCWMRDTLTGSLHTALTALLSLFGVPRQGNNVPLAESHIPFTPPTHSKFDYFVFLNLSQCLGSAVMSFCVIRYITKKPFISFGDLAKFLSPIHVSLCPSSQSSLSMRSSVRVSATSHPSNKKTDAPTTPDRFPPLDTRLFLHYLRVTLCYTFASPFGYASLKHINYVTMNLGKSCKLLPLLLMSVFVRKQKIDRLKILSLFLITAGVAGFMFFETEKIDKKSDHRVSVPTATSMFHHQPGDKSTDARSFRTRASSLLPTWLVSGGGYGIILLLMNLFLDGAMNTWQDEIFSLYKVSSYHMMFHMNWMSAALMLLYLASPLTHELSNALHFLLRYPSFLSDLIMFAFCGAMGQIFVFYTIEKFGAMSLVTVTVTRKLFTILLSVFYFDHQLNALQWLSVAVVFLALGIESFISNHRKRVMPARFVFDSVPVETKLPPYSMQKTNASSEFEILDAPPLFFKDENHSKKED